MASDLSIYVKEKGAFEFHPGPLFAQVVLADEINRATPKAQSALLEAMAEGQVTHDGATYPLPEPFFVIATQNPLNQIGTHPLPESQLDRFTMRLSLGYPDQSSERALYLGGGAPQDIEAVLTAAQVVALQAAADAVHVAPALVDYVLALVNATRTDAQVQMGLSPRAGLALLAAARAWALIDARDAVLPEDVQAVFKAVAAHRLLPTGGTLSATALAQRRGNRCPRWRLSHRRRHRPRRSARRVDWPGGSPAATDAACPDASHANLPARRTADSGC